MNIRLSSPQYRTGMPIIGITKRELNWSAENARSSLKHLVFYAIIIMCIVIRNFLVRNVTRSFASVASTEYIVVHI